MSDPSRAPPPGTDELLRLMVESTTDYAIFATDPAGLVTSWNTGAERLLGFREPEILGRSADMIFPPEEGGATAAEEERRRALRDGRAEDERWHMRRDGTRFWAAGLLMPLATPEAGFVKVLRDRTRDHAAAARLRESEERFRLLAINIPQMVFRCDPEGFRTWGNPQWMEFTGLDLGQSTGLGWLRAIHPDDVEATRAGWREARQRGLYDVEHRVLRASDAAWRWHQTRARSIRDPTGTHSTDWVGTTTDIHDLRGLNDRQMVLMAELQHRTRNLLAVTQAIAGQTLRTSASLEEFKAQFYDRLHALSRVQALLARSNQQSVDLRDLLMAELLAHGGTPAADRMRIEGPAAALPPIAAQALGLALHELATNALKYGALSQRGGTLSVSWKIRPVAGGQELALVWVETGLAPPPGGAQEPPRRRGYGSHLIEHALPYQLNAATRLDFTPDGVRCEIVVPLEMAPMLGEGG